MLNLRYTRFFFIIENTQRVVFKATKIATIITVLFLFFNVALANTERCGSEGYKVQFSYNNYEKEREIAYEYFAKNLRYADKPIDKKMIGIDLYDINDDGQFEILAYLKQDICPRSGCPFVILGLQNNKYHIISFGPGHMAIQDEIFILQHQTKKFHDICFSSQVIWKWNGHNYFLSELINDN